jgi:hypothetical protein
MLAGFACADLQNKTPATRQTPLSASRTGCLSPRGRSRQREFEDRLPHQKAAVLQRIHSARIENCARSRQVSLDLPVSNVGVPGHVVGMWSGQMQWSWRAVAIQQLADLDKAIGVVYPFRSDRKVHPPQDQAASIRRSLRRVSQHAMDMGLCGTHESVITAQLRRCCRRVLSETRVGSPNRLPAAQRQESGSVAPEVNELTQLASAVPRLQPDLAVRRPASVAI